MRARIWSYIIYGAAAVVLVSSSAVAGPAEIGALMKILTEELKSGAELNNILKSSQQAVSTMREATDIAKAAAQGIRDVRYVGHLSSSNAILEDLLQSPVGRDLTSIRTDIRNIADLKRVTPQAERAVQGGLWSFFYGPSIDHMEALHDNEMATRSEAAYQIQQEALSFVEEKYIDGLEKDCQKGAGACSYAASQAQIQTARKLNDLQNAAARQTQMAARNLANSDRIELDRAFAHQRFARDLDEAIAWQKRGPVKPVPRLQENLTQQLGENLYSEMHARTLRKRKMAPVFYGRTGSEAIPVRREQ